MRSPAVLPFSGVEDLSSGFVMLKMAARAADLLFVMKSTFIGPARWFSAVRRARDG